MSGALVDFGLFVFHNARHLQARDRGPYFYLPKLEAMEEAALWNDVMSAAESELELPPDCMKATVLIETLPAAFQMHEILHALRGRIVGLNCGRWDYIFSYLKTFRAHRDRLLPDRSQVLMTVPFLKSYSELLIQTCHRRGAFAMGGMAAQIPIKGDDAARTRRPWPRCAPTSCAKCRPAMTAPGSPIRRWCRWRRKCSTSTCPRPTNWTWCAPMSA